MSKLDRFAILSIFLVYNEGDIKNVQIEEKDILRFFDNYFSEGETLNCLHLNTADKLLRREEIIDPPHYDLAYTLTDKGVDKLFEISGLDFNEEFVELNEFNSLVYALLSSNLHEKEKSAYESTMNEVVTCFKNDCLNATVSLCGKLVEIYLTDLLTKHQIKIEWFSKGPNDTAAKFTEDLTLNQLFILAKSKLSEVVKTASLDTNQIEIIKNYRNAAIHHNKSSIKPSKDVALGIIHFTSHFLRHRLTWD
jgi:hypothetical protein